MDMISMQDAVFFSFFFLLGADGMEGGLGESLEAPLRGEDKEDGLWKGLM